LRTIVPLHLASDWTSPFNAPLLKKKTLDRIWRKKVCKLLLNYNEGEELLARHMCFLGGALH